MPTKSFKLGPGVLTLGAGGALAIEAQLANCRVEWSENVQSSDAVPTLDGGELPAEETATYRATLAGNLVQDISAGGVIDWSWTNKGTEQPFTFVPTTDEGRQVTGVLVPVPVQLGGDVKTRNRSDFSWRIIGEPDLDAIPAGP